MTLYQLTEEFEQLLQIAEDPDADEQTIADTMEALTGEIEDKIDGYATVINSMFADIETIRAEERRLAERRRIFEDRIARMKTAVKSAMELTGKTKVQTAVYTVSIRKSPAKLVIDDESLIPERFWKPQEPVLDKAALREAIKEEWSPAAHLVQGTALVIK